MPRYSRERSLHSARAEATTPVQATAAATRRARFAPPQHAHDQQSVRARLSLSSVATAAARANRRRQRGAAASSSSSSSHNVVGPSRVAGGADHAVGDAGALDVCGEFATEREEPASRNAVRRATARRVAAVTLVCVRGRGLGPCRDAANAKDTNTNPNTKHQTPTPTPTPTPNTNTNTKHTTPTPNTPHQTPDHVAVRPGERLPQPL